MKDVISEYRATMVYPGLYVPLCSLGELEKDFQRRNKIKRKSLPVKLTDLGDSFRVDIKAPGVNREDFIVYAVGNILFVELVQDGHRSYIGQTFAASRFKQGNFGCRIELPENADLEFISAEYREGILRLIVPKANEPAGFRTSLIAVY